MPHGVRKQEARAPWNVLLVHREVAPANLTASRTARATVLVVAASARSRDRAWGAGGWAASRVARASVGTATRTTAMVRGRVVALPPRPGASSHRPAVRNRSSHLVSRARPGISVRPAPSRNLRGNSAMSRSPRENSATSRRLRETSVMNRCSPPRAVGLVPRPRSPSTVAPPPWPRRRRPLPRRRLPARTGAIRRSATSRCVRAPRGRPSARHRVRWVPLRTRTTPRPAAIREISTRLLTARRRMTSWTVRHSLRIGCPPGGACRTA